MSEVLVGVGVFSVGFSVLIWVGGEGPAGIFAEFKQAEINAENCGQYTIKNTLKCH